MDKRNFAYGFAISFGILSWYLYKNNDAIASTIAHDGLIGMFWYFISNMSYVLLLFTIIFLNRDAGVGVIRNTMGALLLIYAIDIVSFPRFSPTGLTQDIIMLASSDAIFINKLVGYGLTYSVVYTFYYLVLPILLIIISMNLLGINNFYQRVFKSG